MKNLESNAPKEMFRELENWFQRYNSCAVAYSGGVDSSVLAFTAKSALGEKAVAVLSRSPALSKVEHELAVEIAEKIGIRLFEVDQDDLGTAGYVKNNVNRCYFCRSNLSKAMDPILTSLKIGVKVDGTHLDDMHTPRPGIKALREAGFLAPFVELSYSKEDIRAIARLAQLPNAERPSDACLSSRIAFGQRINNKTLSMVEEAESIVRQITHAKIVRVRTIATKALVEVDTNSISLALENEVQIRERLLKTGYKTVIISKEGYASGRMLELFIKSERN